MGSVSKLLQLISLIGVLILFAMVAGAAAAAVAAAQVLKPGCKHKCGDVEIPFPFGLSKDCFLVDDINDQSFNITCDGSDPKTGDLIVKNISIEAHEMHVLMYVAKDCYLESGTRNHSNGASLEAAQFTISKTRNQFTVLGCDTVGYLRGYQNGERYWTGCVSKCYSRRNVVNDSCSGVGCCKVEFPDGLRDIETKVKSFDNHTGIWNFNPCGYAFVVEQGKFNFSTYYLQNMPDEMPMVLDWAIGNETCEEAKKKPNFACRNNSICHDPETRSGYQCKCESGYQGNPYLPDGCKDIDECNDPIRTHNCSTAKGCVNTPGGYTCRCPKWYHGNGTKDHGGCDADFVIIIRIAIGKWYDQEGRRMNLLMNFREAMGITPWRER